MARFLPRLATIAVAAAMVFPVAGAGSVRPPSDQAAARDFGVPPPPPPAPPAPPPGWENHRYCDEPISLTMGDLSRFSDKHDRVSVTRRERRMSRGASTGPISLGVVDASLKSPIVVEFPPTLLGTGVSGSVMVLVAVSKSGRVQDALAICGDHPLFVEAALAGVRAAVFHPAMIDGRPVAEVVKIPVSFEP